MPASFLVPCLMASSALDLMAKLLEHATKQGKVADPKPLPRAALSAIENELGCALPPSLRAWLTFDTGWLARTLGWFDARAIPAIPITELAELHCGADVYEAFLQARLPGKAVALDGGSDSLRLLWLGDPDAEGENPVLFLDHDSSATIGVQFPSFAVWLADALEYWKDGVAYNRHKTPRQEISARLLGRKSDLEVDGTKPKKVTSFVPSPPPGAHDALVLPAAPAGKPRKLTDGQLVKALTENSETGDVDRIRTLLADFAARELDAAKLLGGALLKAASNRHPEAVKALLTAGASVTVRDPTYGSPLGMAVWCWHTEEARVLGVVRALIVAGDDPNGPYASTCVLHHAAASATPAVVAALLEAGADPKRIADDASPLVHMAGERQDAETIAVLVKAGAPFADTGTTALHRAAAAGMAQNVTALLAAGAPYDSVDRDEDTALHLAFRHGHLGIARALIAAGARRDVPDARGLTMDRIFDAAGGDARRVDVAAFASDEPQNLTFEVEVVCPAEMQCGTHMPDLLVALAQRAALTLNEKVAAIFKPARVPNGSSTVRATLRVDALDPRLLALATRSFLITIPQLRYRPGWARCVAIAIRGSATAGTKVDVEAFRRRLFDPALTLARPELPFPVHAAKGPGALVFTPRAALDDQARSEIEETVDALVRTLSLLPDEHGSLLPGGYPRFGSKARPKAKTSATFELGLRKLDELEPHNLPTLSEQAMDVLHVLLGALHLRVPLAKVELAQPGT